jgi:hypothetical protein
MPAFKQLPVVGSSQRALPWLGRKGDGAMGGPYHPCAMTLARELLGAPNKFIGETEDPREPPR